jgi:hypothetical protein
MSGSRGALLLRVDLVAAAAGSAAAAVADPAAALTRELGSSAAAGAAAAAASQEAALASDAQRALFIYARGTRPLSLRILLPRPIFVRPKLILLHSIAP